MIFTVLIIFSLFGLLSYYIIFSQIKLSSFDLENNHFSDGISVIICAKNELVNIKRFFPSWINQKYPNFELIIVNDQSTDGSLEYLKKLETAYKHLRIVNIPLNTKKVLQGKRHALWQGIQASKNNYLFFTDADCEPFSKHWLFEMSKAFTNKKTEVIIGFGPYFEANTFLNKLVQYETFLTGLQYLSFAEIGFPYMSVGRNVAYKKDLLTQKAFKNSNKTISGDDDLIFQELANKENVAYCLTNNTKVYSVAPKNFKEWIFQKKRHLSAGIYYSNSLKFFLGFFIFLNYLFLFSIPFVAAKSIPLAIIFIIFKYLFFFSLLAKNKLVEITLFNFLKHYTFIDLVYWIFYTIFAVALYL